MSLTLQELIDTIESDPASVRESLELIKRQVAAYPDATKAELADALALFKDGAGTTQRVDVETLGAAISARQADSVSALRSGSFPASLDRIWLSQYYADTPRVGGGELQVDRDDTTTADNGVTVFIDADGVRWKRNITSGFLSLRDAGAEPEVMTDQFARIKSAFEIAEDNELSIIPEGRWYYVETSGTGNEIRLKKVPTIISTLNLKWNPASGTGNRIITVTGIDGLSTVATVTGSPTYNKGQKSLTIATGLSLSPGDWIAIHAGNSPADTDLRHWGVVTQVEGYDSGTGLLEIADSPPHDINYGPNYTDVEIYKLGHDPVGGELNLSVDYTAAGSNLPAHPVIIYFARGFRIPTWHEFETDFGLALAWGCEDVEIGNYYASMTAAQAALRDPRQPSGPFGARNVTHHTFRTAYTTEPDKTFGPQLELHTRYHRIKEYVTDITLGAAPTAGHFQVNGGSHLTVDRAVIRSNQITTLARISAATATGEEAFRCGDLIMDGEAVQFNANEVRGEIEKVDSGGEYKFGPLQMQRYTIPMDGTNQTVVLDNMIVARVWAKCASLTTLNSLVLRNTDNISNAEALDRTSDDVWVETDFDDRVPFDTSISVINRMDQTLKEIFTNANGVTDDIEIMIECRLVAGDQF